MENLVLFARIGEVAVLTLNRPEKRNALNLALWGELEAHIVDIEQNVSAIGAVVLTAAGPDFCAGNDLKERGAVAPRSNYQASIISRLANLPQPVIVAVQGGCYTGGLELALAGDIIFAAEGSRFADTHAKFGLVPVWGMSQRLASRVGTWKAREISFSTAPVNGPDAAQIGLANRCVPDAELEASAIDFATLIAAQSRHSVLAYKRLYAAQQDLGRDAGLAHEVFYSAGPAEDMADRVAGGFGRSKA